MQSSRRLLLASAAICAAAAVPAQAQTGPSSWTGGFVAGSLSYADTDGAMRHENLNFFGGPGGLYDQSDSDWLLGARAGYLYQLPSNLVIGADIAITGGTRIDDNDAYANFFNFTWTDIDEVVSVNATLGFAMGALMPYVRVGYAEAEATTYQDYTVGMGNTFSASRDISGPQYGIGLLYAPNETVFFGLEYMRTDFGRETFSGLDSASQLTEISGQFTQDTLSFIAGVRF